MATVAPAAPSAPLSQSSAARRLHEIEKQIGSGIDRFVQSPHDHIASMSSSYMYYNILIVAVGHRRHESPIVESFGRELFSFFT
jgi:hypothetical protein